MLCAHRPRRSCGGRGGGRACSPTCAPGATRLWWRRPRASTGLRPRAATWPCRRRRAEARLPRGRPVILAALETARDNCTFFHRHELVDRTGKRRGAQGQKLGIRHLPVARAGLVRARRSGRLRLHGDHELRAGLGGRGRGADHLHASGARREGQPLGAGGSPAHGRRRGCSAWAGRRRWPPWPTAPRPSLGWTSSAARATPT